MQRPNQKQTAALYYRMSTADQSTAMQKTTCDGEYCDEGMSGAKVKRPGLGRLMKDARKHLFDVVLVWRVDRFARSVLPLVKALEEFRHVHDRRAFAELERCIIVERVTADVRQAMKKRKYWGPMPIEQADPTITTSIQKLLREGMGCHKIGKRLGVSSRTVWKVLQRGRAV